MFLLFENFFHHLFPNYLRLVFLDSNTNTIKSFKFMYLINKKIVQKLGDHLTKYWVGWKEYKLK